ncbi:MAG: EAL domain-containing protein [Pseudobutyrivibrio sp.]|nr:EAL domain-containing protein [Pseudobutyrivibrio sp.]
MGDKKELKEYVVNNIEKACANGWIEAFYQPVIRTMTNRLCGMESLARWNDPEYGFLSPADFVGPLENANKITMLDCAVLENVCATLSARMRANKPVLPVSVNFSRLDFKNYDMVKIVEETVAKYDLPRHFIHIEITESIVVSNEKLMGRVINDFRSLGYEIWMDDFGSGYSSFNLLKDFQFDMLKLDMDFLSSFTEKSKAIVSSVIIMAKDIGMSTLAEGVETKEQVDFFRTIGCGRMQGYYFGKPEPMETMFDNIKAKGIEIEEPRWDRFYDIAANNAKNTETPLEIIEFDGKNITSLYTNEAYRELSGMDYGYLDESLNNGGDGKEVNKYARFLKKVGVSHNTERYYFASRGNYYCLRAQVLTEFDGKTAIKTTLTNITADENLMDSQRIDSRLREIHHMFEVISLVNVQGNIIEPLLCGFKYVDFLGGNGAKLDTTLEEFAKELVIVTERNLFLEFMDFTTIKDRMEKRKTNVVEQLFRIKQPDGKYDWKSTIIILMPGTGKNEYLFAIKSLPYESQALFDTYAEMRGRNIIKEASLEFNEHANLLENAVWNSGIIFFWKDKKGRFRGVSQAFIEFFNIKNNKELIGKRSEDLSLHVEDELIMQAEREVLKTGKSIYNALGQCVTGGKVKNVLYSIIPTYENGEVVGLMGSIMDRDDILRLAGEALDQTDIDSLTGVMNNKAFVLTLMDYEENYAKTNSNYGVILVEYTAFERMGHNLGESFANLVVQEIANELVKVDGDFCGICRIRGGMFGLIAHVSTAEELNDIAINTTKAIESITEVNGTNVTIRINCAQKIRSDSGIFGENIYQEALKMLKGEE